MLWLEEHVGLPPAELAAALEHRSGLLGLTGTADMRAILALAGTGDRDATVALGVYLHRLRALIAGMAAAMDGLDTLVFTGGVGENAPEIRERTADGLGFLGVAIDQDANRTGTGDRDISAAGSFATTLVIAAREDVQIAHEVRALLGA